MDAKPRVAPLPDKSKLVVRWIAGLTFTGALLAAPAYAQDIAPVSGALNAIHGFLQSTAMRTLAAIAVIGLGVGAMMGRLRWVWVGSVIGGIVVIFGADAIVSFLTKSAGG